MTDTLKLDALIIGGGVAGLWLLNRLLNTGYSAWLFEQDNLGAGQSIASQGMIHGGIKYALSGKDTTASTAIADMPAYWKQCLGGYGDVNLRGCNLLSEDYYMWPRNSIRSRLNAFLGSKALEARVTSVEKDDFPAFFKDRIEGPLYRLQDIVLDVPSLLQALAENCPGRIFRIDWSKAQLVHDSSGHIKGLQITDGPMICAKHYILCCGNGAQALMQDSGLAIADMQRRPLRMVMVKHDNPDPVYVHCVSDKLSMTPELTITSHKNGKGEQVWYLGGELAERGASQTDEEVIDTAKTRLMELFPWCDFSTATWAALAIDRAEAKQPNGKRPDFASIAASSNLMVCWPTKLTLAPGLANQVLARLQAQEIHPGTNPAPIPPATFETPVVAPAPWESL